MKNKKIEIKKQIDFIFKNFEFNKISKFMDPAINLLKSYQYNKDIKSYDIENDSTNKKIVIKIKFHNDVDMIFIIIDDDK